MRDGPGRTSMKQARLAELAKSLARSLGFGRLTGATSGRPESRTTAARADLILGGNEPPGGGDQIELKWINVESSGPRTALLVESIRIAGRR